WFTGRALPVCWHAQQQIKDADHHRATAQLSNPEDLGGGVVGVCPVARKHLVPGNETKKLRSVSFLRCSSFGVTKLKISILPLGAFEVTLNDVPCFVESALQFKPGFIGQEEILMSLQCSQKHQAISSTLIAFLKYDADKGFFFYLYCI
ncbi:hypothetical protein U0070_008990, partial [Myodes glareolus]